MVDVAARQVFPNYSDSDSGDEWVGEAPEEPSVPPPGSLVSQRPRIADYVTDISYQVETEDRQDHSFFGIMFDLEAKNDLPIEHVLLTEIMVRGDLGHVTVWWTPGSFHPVKTRKDAWTCVYDAAHAPSFDTYTGLLIHPVTIAPGSTIGLYIHCRYHSDTALVYDNRRSEVVYEDPYIQVHAGMAHLDVVPFGQRNPWGFGHGTDAAFRANRTFVGRLQLGAKYRLWNPEKELHCLFPRGFREMVKTFLLVARRPAASLPFDDMTLFYIFNMCRYDWFESSPPAQAARSRRVQSQITPSLTQLHRWSGYNHVYEPPVKKAAVEDEAGEAAEGGTHEWGTYRRQGVVLRRAVPWTDDSDDDERFIVRPPANGAGDSDEYVSDSEVDEYHGSVEDSSEDSPNESAESDDEDAMRTDAQAPLSPERPRRTADAAGSPAKAA